MRRKLKQIMAIILLLPLFLFLGALKVKPIEQSASKWNENASRAGEEFATNAAAAAEEWARNTSASVDTYGSAISAPGIKERFRRGVARAGAQKFARKISEVGRDRYGPGISAARDDYKTGAEPYFSTLQSITLDPRKPRGDPANYRRVEQIGKSLNAKRLALLGVTGG